MRKLFIRALFLCMCGMSTLTLSAQETPMSAELTTAEVVVEESGVSGSVMVSKIMETGLTGMALILISVVGFSFAFERLSNLKRSKIVPDGLASDFDKLWKADDLDGVMKRANDKPCTLSRVVTLLAQHRDGAHSDVASIAGDVASRELRIHLQRAYPLAVVATVSPLLGLFGTVFGMIGAFEAVALAGEMGDPSIMAGDISFALITTALGLVIAVPSLIAYHLFRVKTNILGLQLEEQVNHLLIRWFPIVK